MSFTRRAKMHVALSRFGRGKKDPGFFAELVLSEVEGL